MNISHKNIVISSISDENKQEEIIAFMNFYTELDSAWQREDDLVISYQVANFPKNIDNLIQELNIQEFSIEDVEQQNWNEVFESNFEPIEILKGKWVVRATFHPKSKAQNEIIIDPKMSFGTGHHATTRSIMTLMDGIDWTYKKVLDYGSGTGILALMAAKMGATEVIGIDNEEWAYHNSIENMYTNQLQNSINFHHLTLEEAIERSIIEDREQFDVIIANITKNVLISSAEQLNKLMPSGALLFLSGFYSEDISDIENCYKNYGLVLTTQKVEDNWAALLMTKK